MIEAHLRLSEHSRPLIAVVCAVPLLGEAVRSAIDFAEVHAFSERGGDIAGLLRWLRPDAVIVDTEDGADRAEDYAAARALPLLHIAVRERQLRLFYDGEWHVVSDGDGPTPEVIRNVVAGALFSREGARLP